MVGSTVRARDRGVLRFLQVAHTVNQVLVLHLALVVAQRPRDGQVRAVNRAGAGRVQPRSD